MEDISTFPLERSLNHKDWEDVPYLELKEQELERSSGRETEMLFKSGALWQSIQIGTLFFSYQGFHNESTLPKIRKCHSDPYATKVQFMKKKKLRTHCCYCFFSFLPYASHFPQTLLSPLHLNPWTSIMPTQEKLLSGLSQMRILSIALFQQYLSIWKRKDWILAEKKSAVFTEFI